MRVYITKYALTEGIMERDGEETGSGMVRVPTGHCFPEHAYFHRNEWHTTREAAVARAEQMRAAKLKSIEKQQRRILALTF